MLLPAAGAPGKSYAYSPVGAVRTFAPDGENIPVTGTVFRGSVRSIPPATGCTNVTVQGNTRLEPAR